MKKYNVFLAVAALGALPLTAEAFSGHVAGGHVGMGSGPGFGHNFRGPGHANGFAFRHGPFRNFAHDGRFFHSRHRFFRSDFAFFGFGFPYYPYPYSGYLDYPYDGYGYGPAEAGAYANDLVGAVQSELARLGYYRGPIDGELGPESRQAIRKFQLAKGLPATGRIDPKFLRTLERG